MTTEVDIVNRALQAIGTRTTITAAELANNSTNEAIQANLILEQLRDDTLRMAPWNSAHAFTNLVYITSAQGTPENVASGTALWQPGTPPPPWAYEYQYPVDCLRPLYIVPQFQTGFSGGVPLTTAVTGGAAAFWQGPPVKFKVSTDKFFSIISITISNQGSNHAVGDIITLASGLQTAPPIGAPAQVQVDSIGVGGTITGISLINQVNGAAVPQSGSYFAKQGSPIAQGTTTGIGTGATFAVSTSTGYTQGMQRVILTNQEFGLLCYNKIVTDPNVMDPLLQDAWATILGARLAIALTGDKQLANTKVQEANGYILEARKADGNEGLTINDITPDFVRVRGISYSDYSYSPNVDFSWGNLWTPF